MTGSWPGYRSPLPAGIVGGAEKTSHTPIKMMRQNGVDYKNASKTGSNVSLFN